jgi:hypothetical protein
MTGDTPTPLTRTCLVSFFPFPSRMAVLSLSTKESVSRLVTYLVEPAQDDDDDLRKFKYVT